MGERFLDTEEAVRSIRTGPTILKTLSEAGFFDFMKLILLHKRGGNRFSRFSPYLDRSGYNYYYLR